MATRGRPVTANTCHKTKPAEKTDPKIVHCMRRLYHQPPCSNGKWKWTDRAVVARP